MENKKSFDERLKESANIKLIDLLPGSRFEVNKDNIDNYYKTYW